MSDVNVDLNNQTNNQNEMKPPMRIVIIILFFLISIFLLVIIVDKTFTDVFTSFNSKKISATITNVKTMKSKGVSSYWVFYNFEVEKQKYERKSIFGLIKQGTEIRRSEAVLYPEGNSIDVVYSLLDPKINRAINDPYKNDKNVFMIVGILLFGFIALNETKNMIRKIKQ